MAQSYFTQKLHEERDVQYPSRRKLTNNSTGVSKVVSVKRAEGNVLVEGDMFNAVALNNLESRVAKAFEEVSKAVEANTLDYFFPVGRILMSLKNLELEKDASKRSAANKNLFPGAKWIRIADRRLLVPATTAGSQGGAETCSFVYDGDIVINPGSQYVHPHTVTEAETPTHTHLYNDTYAGAMKVVTKSGGEMGPPYWQKSEDDYWVQKRSNNTDTSNNLTGYTGGTIAGEYKHNHNISLSWGFPAATKSISVVQRCIKVYCYQRIDG